MLLFTKAADAFAASAAFITENGISLGGMCCSKLDVFGKLNRGMYYNSCIKRFDFLCS